MRKPVTLIILLTVSLLLYIILVGLGDLRNKIEYYLLIFGFLFAIYMTLVILAFRSKNNLPVHWIWFLIVALLSRLVLLPASPTLSYNVAGFLGSREIILLVKILLLMVETVLVFFLIRLLQYFSLNTHRLIIFLFNPLLIIETYYNSHLEIIAAMFLWLAIFAFYRQNNRFTFAGILLSVIVKPFSFIMAIPFLFKRFWQKFVPLLIIAVVILFIFSMHGTFSRTEFLPDLEPEIFHGAIFKSITYLIDISSLPERKIVMDSSMNLNVDSTFYYIFLALLVIILITLDQMRKLKPTSHYRSVNYLQASFILTGTGILLLPQLPPSYLIAIIPFLLFLPNWSWLCFTCLIQISYYALKVYAHTGGWHNLHWILLLIYIPFYSLLIWEYFDRRQIKGWFLNKY